MDEADRLRYEAQSKDLRLELKTWESDFAKSHNGSKPGRDDIKANPKIGMALTRQVTYLPCSPSNQLISTASMYKNYNKLRDILSGKIPPPQPPRPSSSKDKDDDDDDKTRKRKPHNPHSLTPSSKRFRPAETPSRTPHATTTTTAVTTAVTPSLSRQLFSPTVPTSIGPTPQRDGRVLGLFDFLPFKNAEIESPSKPNRSVRATNAVTAGRAAVAATTTTTQPHKNGAAVHETPSRGRYTMDTGLGIEVDLSRTPTTRQSSSRPQQQSPRKGGIPATPSRRKHDGSNDNRAARTPSSTHSVSRLQFQTPSFLRRIPMARITEDSEFVSPEPIRLPRKPMVRGLSSILADLRRTEEEQLDDDLDALREMEGEGTTTKPPAGEPSNTEPAPEPAPESKQARDARDVDSILAEDSQKQNMTLLGGFDDEGMYDSQDGEQEGVDRGGRPLKVYKKKGQKRTTRKANMRPVRTKRPSTGQEQAGEGEGDGDNDGIVPETQPSAPRSTRQRGRQEADDPALLSGSESAGSEYDDDEDELAQDYPPKPKKTAGKSSTKGTAPAAKTKGDDKPAGKVKKAARKVNELAHANFKRLKLRNSGAKGGAGFNSRFRRRR